MKKDVDTLIAEERADTLSKYDKVRGRRRQLLCGWTEPHVSQTPWRRPDQQSRCDLTSFKYE